MSRSFARTTTTNILMHEAGPIPRRVSVPTPILLERGHNVAEPVQKAPTMTVEQTEEYRKELKKELFDLEYAQTLFFSEYKSDRINRIKQRLGIPVD